MKTIEESTENLHGDAVERAAAAMREALENVPGSSWSNIDEEARGYYRRMARAVVPAYEEQAAELTGLRWSLAAVDQMLDGRSDHDVVSVELLRRVLADAPADRLLEQTITEQMIDVEDLASLRRKAAMLPVVLLWRDATANALSALVAAVDDQGPGNALLAVAAAHARDVLTVDPEKAYGVAGPVEDVVELDWLRRELAAMREAHDGACQTVAAMHAAAVGEVRGPILGVVEDVADVRAKLAATEAGLDEAVRYATTLEETVAELRQHPARLVEMAATVLDVSQQIRLETARLLMGDWPSIAAGDDEDEDATIGAFARDMLRLATAIETGSANGDPRDTPERRDERAKWTKDIAEMFRGFTASPDYDHFCKMADHLDPPRRDAELARSQDGNGPADSQEPGGESRLTMSTSTPHETF